MVLCGKGAALPHRTMAITKDPQFFDYQGEFGMELP
jgi:hypothetical protein